MSFIQAVWYLKENGFGVKPSSTFSNHGRLYVFIDDDTCLPILLSRLAIQSMADLFEHGVGPEGNGPHPDAAY
jgi:hypothetical protein